MTRRLIDVRLDRLDEGHNVRRKVDAGLRASIAEHGVLEPIVVCQATRGRYEVLYGHRRVKAARLAGLMTIPAIVERRPDDLPIRQVIENIDRQPMNAIDIALALRAHLDAHPGLTQADLAKAVGRSGYWVSRKLALLELDPEIRARIALGELGENRALDGRIDGGPARKSRPRILQAGDAPGRSRSIVIPLTNVSGGHRGQAVIGVDLDDQHIDFVVEDGTGRSLMFTLSGEEARLLGRRLQQAYEAVAVAS